MKRDAVTQQMLDEYGQLRLQRPIRGLSVEETARLAALEKELAERVSCVCQPVKLEPGMEYFVELVNRRKRERQHE